jgi:hypothetical protein
MSEVHRWKVFAQIESQLRKVGGTIFGGYVRDKILHDSQAREFYSSFRRDDYSNPDVAPALKDRLLLPSDIDCVIDCAHVVICALKEVGFDVKKVEAPSRLEYQHSNFQRLVVSPQMTPILKGILSKSLDVQVDLVLMSPLNLRDLDFECNGLIIASSGDYGLSPSFNIDCPLERHEKVHAIIEDIKMKKALMIKYEFKRVNKMAMKGWLIMDEWTQWTSEETQEICVICHGDVSGDHVKRGCCSLTYHVPCYVKMREMCQSCPMCRVPFEM